MNDFIDSGIGPVGTALVVTAFFIYVPAADAAETVHMPMEGQTQGDDRRPDVQPDPIGKSARPDDVPGRARSRESRGRGHDDASKAGPATTGIEHEDIGSAARAKAGADKKPHKGRAAPGAQSKAKRSSSAARRDTVPDASSVKDRKRAADDDEVNRR